MPNFTTTGFRGLGIPLVSNAERIARSIQQDIAAKERVNARKEIAIRVPGSAAERVQTMGRIHRRGFPPIATCVVDVRNLNPGADIINKELLRDIANGRPDILRSDASKVNSQATEKEVIRDEPDASDNSPSF